MLPPIPSLSIEITGSRSPEYYCYRLGGFSQSSLDIRQATSTRSAPLPSPDIQLAPIFQRSSYSFGFLPAILGISSKSIATLRPTTANPALYLGEHVLREVTNSELNEDPRTLSAPARQKSYSKLSDRTTWLETQQTQLDPDSAVHLPVPDQPQN